MVNDGREFSTVTRLGDQRSPNEAGGEDRELDLRADLGLGVEGAAVSLLRLFSTTLALAIRWMSALVTGFAQNFNKVIGIRLAVPVDENRFLKQGER